MKTDSYAGWDSTGAYLLAYAMPLRAIHLTGKRPGVVPQLDVDAARSLILDGRGWSNKDRNGHYDGLSQDELLRRLGSWSPVVRERAAMALGRRRDDVTDRLTDLLDATDLHTRYGACQALGQQGERAAAAVPALLETFGADDLWLRILAANALAVTVSGGHLEGVGSADGNAPNGTGLEVRLMGEVGHAAARQGLTLQDANRIIDALLVKYEPVFDKPGGNPGQCIDKAYDLEKMVPVPDWQRMYDEVAEELAELGLNLA